MLIILKIHFNLIPIYAAGFINFVYSDRHGIHNSLAISSCRTGKGSDTADLPCCILCKSCHAHGRSCKCRTNNQAGHLREFFHTNFLLSRFLMPVFE